MTDKEPCDDHDEWHPYCDYCRGMFGGTRENDGPQLSKTADNDELRALIEKWRDEQADYPDTDMGNVAAAAVRLCADELEALLSD